MREAFSLRRIAVAVGIAAAIYAIGLGTGSLLYVTGAIGTGATHNDCEDYRMTIAEERGIEEEDVPQEDIKAATEACLATHELTEEEAFREQFLFWSAWPGVICAVVFLFWPVWTRVLLNQEAADPPDATGGGHHAAKQA